MYVQRHGVDKLMVSGNLSSAGYGCCFELSEVTYKSIAKLLYFKICYDVKERVIKWVEKSLETLLHS